ncbi:MAG: hypothetical protein QW265_03720 [Candidatus Bathyarchaeia archaeon]
MSFKETLSADAKGLSSLDIMLAVVIGVISRIYMLVGSPAINVIIHGMGVLGDFVNAATFLVPLYAILILPGAMRSNGITAWLAAMLMSILRLLTGDPFGWIACQAYLVAGFFTWLVLAYFKYKPRYLPWFAAAFVWTFWVDLIFGIYFGIWPWMGSMILGLIAYLILERIINGIIVAAVILYAIRALQKVESLRGVIVQRG